MRFIVDEDMPRPTAGFLIERGHDAVDVRDIGLRGASDSLIAEVARIDGLCIITMDLGFADIRNFPPEDYSGIVVLIDDSFELWTMSALHFYQYTAHMNVILNPP